MGRLVMVLGGTPATHKLGDIGRDEDDVFVVHEERGDILIGNWLEGFGFVHVEVPRDRTRKLTHAEADKLQGGRLVIGDHASDEMAIDPSEVEDGWESNGHGAIRLANLKPGIPSSWGPGQRVDRGV
jgi:hypothetical protein